MISKQQTSYEQLNEQQVVSEGDPFTIERYRQFWRHLSPHTQVVLDIGCNTGRGGKVLKQSEPKLQIFGLDCVESRLANLPEGIYDREICGYSTDVPLADASVDAIVAGEFIEHLYPEDVAQTIAEFYRLLKPHGKLLLTTPNPEYLRLKLTNGSVLGGAHVSEHYPANLKHQLATANFTKIKICGSGKVSRLVGEGFPILSIYGSYLVIAEKS